MKFKIREEPLGFIAAEYGSGETYEIICDGSMELCNKESLIDDNICDECTFHSNTETRHKELGAPLTMVVYPTYDCNVRCKFCYVYANEKPHKQIMTNETVSSIFKYANAHGVSHIDILGGEPFLDIVKDKTYSLVEQAVEYGIRPYLSTNAQLLTKRDIEWIRDVQENYSYFEIAVSLHGVEDIHDVLMGRGTFKKAISVLNEFENNKIQFIISTTIDSLNIDTVPELYIRVLSKYRMFKSWIFNYPPMSPRLAAGIELPTVPKAYGVIHKINKLVEGSIEIIGNIPFTYKIEQVDLPRTQVERLFTGCSAGRTKIEIAPDGTVYPCAYLIGIDEFAMGNINTLVEWDKYADRNQWKVIPSTCSSCEYYTVCTGCLAYAYFAGKEYDDRCPYQRQSKSKHNQ